LAQRDHFLLDRASSRCSRFAFDHLFTSLDTIFLNLRWFYFGEAELPKKGEQMKVEPSPMASDVRRIALTVRENFVLFSELVGSLRKRSFVLQRAGAVFTAQG
jgi:hypothetical protein